MQTKGEQRRRKGFIGFSRNLLISFDYGQLRQVLMKLVVRLLTNLKTVESAPLIPKKRRFSGPSLEPSWNQVGTRLLGMRQFCRAHLAKEDYLRIATIHPETPDAPASRIARPGFVPSAVVEFSNSLAT